MKAGDFLSIILLFVLFIFMLGGCQDPQSGSPNVNPEIEKDLDQLEEDLVSFNPPLCSCEHKKALISQFRELQSKIKDQEKEGFSLDERLLEQVDRIEKILAIEGDKNKPRSRVTPSNVGGEPKLKIEMEDFNTLQKIQRSDIGMPYYTGLWLFSDGGYKFDKYESEYIPDQEYECQIESFDIEHIFRYPENSKDYGFQVLLAGHYDDRPPPVKFNSNHGDCGLLNNEIESASYYERDPGIDSGTDRGSRLNSVNYYPFVLNFNKNFVGGEGKNGRIFFFYGSHALGNDVFSRERGGFSFVEDLSRLSPYAKNDSNNRHWDAMSIEEAIGKYEDLDPQGNLAKTFDQVLVYEFAENRFPEILKKSPNGYLLGVLDPQDYQLIRNDDYRFMMLVTSEEGVPATSNSDHTTYLTSLFGRNDVIDGQNVMFVDVDDLKFDAIKDPLGFRVSKVCQCERDTNYYQVHFEMEAHNESGESAVLVRFQIPDISNKDLVYFESLDSFSKNNIINSNSRWTVDQYYYRKVINDTFSIEGIVYNEKNIDPTARIKIRAIATKKFIADLKKKCPVEYGIRLGTDHHPSININLSKVPANTLDTIKSCPCFEKYLNPPPQPDS